MDAKEGERRVRNRVDEPAHEPFGLVSKRVVVAAKRDDPHGWPRPGEPRDTIGLEAGAPDHRACPKRALVGVDPHLTGVQLEPPDRATGQDQPACFRDVLGVGARHRAVVDDPRARCVQRTRAHRVRLDLAQLVAVQDA